MAKKIVVLFLGIILIVSLVVGCGSKEEAVDKTKVEENYVPVEIGKIEKKTISNEIVFSGKVFANKEVMVMPKVPGKVESTNIKVGDKVAKDQVLFTLEKDDIQDAVDNAKVALDGAKANYKLTEEKIQNAKKAFERSKELYQEGAISEAQFEQAKVAASDNSLEAAKSQLNTAQVGYDQAVEAMENASVESPIGGVVSAVNIEAGEFASNAQAAVTIVDMDKVYVQVDISENIINQLYKDKSVNVEIPSASQEEFVGKIDTISPTTDPRTQLYPVKIYIGNKDHTIKPGMFVKVKVDTDIKENVNVIPSEAVLDNEGETIVYVLSNENAKVKKVDTGLDTGTYIEIKSGISESDKVIIKGQNFVEDGTKVKVVRGEK
ncbi:efflux RND transporter periplasmic adaptor subunit [Clostridiisalibacter paucivorans]|uniref:efflux RND transporter periplasmic adaptor subunit n=1 Tax=Clostridiisalibacter paucivorans TaxID=408753 RepID=UPI00047D6F4D|nr:efflux RND transporter periplasmic adaptor subunit [Clostridiisalibacter paucivorans]